MSTTMTAQQHIIFPVSCTPSWLALSLP